MPSSGEYAMYLGIALKQSGDTASATEAFARAIQLAHSLQRPYLELSAIEAKVGRSSEAASVLDEYLKWNPGSVLVRLMRQTLTAAPRLPGSRSR
jgi:predicted TPR repeat methyltransferase